MSEKGILPKNALGFRKSATLYSGTFEPSSSENFTTLKASSFYPTLSYTCVWICRIYTLCPQKSQSQRILGI